MAVALGHSASEARDTQIQAPGNVERVLRELEGCSLVVLSGNKASILAEALRKSGKSVIEVAHVGNKGLNGKYKIPDRLKLASPLNRRGHRVQLWADDVLGAIRPS